MKIHLGSKLGIEIHISSRELECDTQYEKIDGLKIFQLSFFFIRFVLALYAFPFC